MGRTNADDQLAFVSPPECPDTPAVKPGAGCLVRNYKNDILDVKVQISNFRR